MEDVHSLNGASWTQSEALRHGHGYSNLPRRQGHAVRTSWTLLCPSVGPDWEKTECRCKCRGMSLQIRKII
eukprot:2075496-Amphidinium_carterae.1